MENKLRTGRGETLVETMVAMLLVTLVVAFLTMAIVTSSRINARIKNQDYAFQAIPAAGAALPTATVSINGAKLDVSLHETAKGYLYYDPS